MVWMLCQVLTPGEPPVFYPPAPTVLSIDRLSNIEDIAETAGIILDYIKADNHEVSGLVRGFIEKRLLTWCTRRES
jgi:hypothetical protein